MQTSKITFTGKKLYWKKCPHCSGDKCYRQREHRKVISGYKKGELSKYYLVRCQRLDRIGQDVSKKLNSFFSQI